MLRASRGGRDRSSEPPVELTDTTIPRHLRDVFVTECGIADLRGKSDQDWCRPCSPSATRASSTSWRRGRRAGQADPPIFTVPERWRQNDAPRFGAAPRPGARVDCSPTFLLRRRALRCHRQRLLPALQWLKRANATARRAAGSAGTLRAGPSWMQPAPPRWPEPTGSDRADGASTCCSAGSVRPRGDARDSSPGAAWVGGSGGYTDRCGTGCPKQGGAS